ncbi:MAG: hypothetical protein FJX11_21070 [Alphaproteobacteria bacterium]|nr:hypothetical protein [Alphaproteobacteria bacterium]
MSKKRLPRAGGQSAAVPAVRSMTDRDPAAPATASSAGEPEKPADEPDDKLTRTIKAAYQ